MRASAVQRAPVLALDEFLRLASAAAAALAEVHERVPFHGRLSSATVVFDYEARTATIADSATADDNYPAVGPDWAYVSPEQTGRLRRPVDARSDLYSLGVVLYELLTGALPFQANDPLEWTHRHLAAAPRPAIELVPGLPPIASDILLRLLAKDPDDRYQSALGLLHDLRRCAEGWTRSGQIAAFPLGQSDQLERFVVPQKIYGRDAKRRRLERALARAIEDQVPRVQLVVGRAGVGKSALVRELAVSVASAGGLFVTGKFEEVDRGVPFAPIVAGFRDLAGLLVSGSDEQVAVWRARLRDALGANGRLITDLLPDFEFIVGRQPPVAQLPPAAAQLRFAMVFRRFLRALVAEERPLVLFVDDLQWADAASLRVLADVVTDRSLGSLLLVGAYRDDEVAEGSSLEQILTEIRAAGTPIEQFELRPLTAAPLTELLAEALHMDAVDCEPLQRLLMEKTHGNPLFFTQLLVELAGTGLMQFDREALTWTWDLERIAAEAFSENVVDLLAERLERCAPQTQQALSLAACVGDSFELGSLAKVVGRSSEEMARAFDEAVTAGLLVHSQEGYAFCHDRIREAAYAGIPRLEREQMHLRVGRGLLAECSAEELPDQIFQIVSQLDRGSAALADAGERRDLAHLNHLAAQRAHATTAFGAASEYCLRGMTLLGPDGWSIEHGLMFAFALERAACELYAGNLEEVERLVQSALVNAQTRLERALCHRVGIDLHTTRGEMMAALEDAIDCLRLYGLQLTPHPSVDEVDAVGRDVAERLGSRSPESLIDLPLGEDADIEAELDVLAGMLPSAYFADLHLHRLIACHLVGLTLTHGVFAASSMGFSAYGFELANQQRYAEADRYGRVGLALVERHNFAGYRAKVCNLMGAAISPWTRDLQASIRLSRDGVRAGKENGDVLFACLNWLQAVVLRLAAGDALDEVDREADEAIAFVRAARFDPLADVSVLIKQLVRSLQGRTDDEGSLSGEGFDEAAFVERLPAHPLPLIQTWYHLYALEARVLAGDVGGALASMDALTPLVVLLRGQHAEADAAFFSVLAIAAAWKTGSPSARAGWLATLRLSCARLRVWADSCPENFLHFATLAAAELASIEGHDAQALQLYATAAELAAERHPHASAIAHERTARAMLRRELRIGAEAHLREARRSYARWGALGKVRQLEREFPAITSPAGSAEPVTASGLDLLAVAKAGQVISGEIVLERLLEKLLDVVIAEAGARRGALLLVSADGLAVAATAEVEGEATAATIHDPPIPPTSNVLPVSVINYVNRTREPLILGNAADHGPFSSDTYVARRRVKALLCAPIVAQGELRGLLYLENDLMADVFTRDRLAVLDLLAGQAAISLENAMLYASLRREMAERERSEQGLRDSEAQLRQVQKMEAIGQLAGGIAHDFNNLMTAVVGYSAFALKKMDPDDPLRLDIEEIRRAGERAAELTHQLLAFSRKQILQPRPLDLNAVVASLEMMLRRLIGGQADLVCEYGSEIGVVNADPGQLEQTIVNLVLNARDAMPDGGTVTISTGSVERYEGGAEQLLDARPGQYVRLSVKDTGTGLDATTQAHMFEPFFTTKRLGEGTGLGLSTVFGIVQQSGGHIGVETELGHGTTFDIYFPRVSATALPVSRTPPPSSAPAGTETTLVVEDEDSVRSLIAGVLRELGYTVVEAKNGVEALEMHARHPSPIAFMITDVVMPGLTGPALAQRLAPLAPQMKVLFISGYAADTLLRRGALDDGVAFLQKPFTPDVLAIKAREILDRTSHRS